MNNYTLRSLIAALDILKGGDPTNGGKLSPVHIIDKNGHHTVRYKSPEEIATLHKSGEHAHVEPLAAGHRFSHSKNGPGTITKVKGHDGKGGHELNVVYDSGKKSTAYAHNLEHHNPLEVEAERKALPAPVVVPKVVSTPSGGNAKRGKEEPLEDVDDFDDPDLLTPKERMQEWERMIYRLTKPGHGVNAAIAYGKGGVGKTYRAMKMLTGLKNAAGEPMQEGKDYVTFTGGTTAAALYETLYNNNGKLILLDDFDDVFKNEDCVNMLKGACDTGAKRPVNSAKAENPDNPSPYPTRFLFTGKIAFISNLNLDHMADKSRDIEALLSRADSMNLRMTNSQTVDLIKTDIINAPNFTFRKANGNAIKTTQADKDAVMGFVEEHKHGLQELSVRTLGKINALKNFYEDKGESWEDKATSMLVKGRQDDLDVNQRFDAYGDFVNILADGGVKSVIAYGRGGIGKTYTAISKLHEMGMTDVDDLDGEDGEEGDPDEDRSKQFIHMSGGKFTAKGLYEAMYKHNGRLIVIDDADTALTNTQAQAILKGALDSSGSGKVNWLTSDSNKKKPKELPKQKKKETDSAYQDRLKADGLIGDDGERPESASGVPNEFEFNGRMLFISNLDQDKIAQPLQSRALTINTQMSRDQAIERFKHVAKVKRATGAKPSSNVDAATHNDVDEVIAHFESLKDKVPDRHFNNRTIDRMLADKVHADNFKGPAAEIPDWKRTVKTKLLKGLDYGVLNNGLIKFDPIEYKINQIQKGMDNNIQKALEYFQKAEGSKGGHVIGHTASGKPVYASGKGTSKYSGQDHFDAAAHHEHEHKNMIESPKGDSHYVQSRLHEESAREHNKQGVKKTGKTRSGKTIGSMNDNHSGYSANDHRDVATHRSLSMDKANYPQERTKYLDSAQEHNRIADKMDYDSKGSISKGLMPDIQKALGFFEKAEGSKGGHVIGHTASGKPVYASTKTNHGATAKYTAQDHLEAGRMHNQAMGAATNNRNKAAKNKDHDQVTAYNHEINEHERNVKMHRAGYNDMNKGESATDLQKALGFFEKAEGVRGGKVIGHTKSNKPIYAHNDSHEYSGFSKQDHHDASNAHHKEAAKFQRKDNAGGASRIGLNHSMRGHDHTTAAESAKAE